MTYKQKLILDYLNDKGGKAYYIDIRDTVGKDFDNEEDFDRTLNKLIAYHLVFENDQDTFYKLTFPELTVVYAVPHVTLFLDDKEQFQLRIEDYELFDTFDDLLSEHFDIDFEYLFEEKNGLRICTIFFKQIVDEEALIDNLKSIDEKEIERIFRLNNQPDNRTYR